MNKIKTYKDLVNKVSEFKIDKNIDLSSGEDLSIGIMNLISIEEHLFYTSQKLKSPKYLKMLNEVRLMRTDLMKDIVKDPEGEVWCISKHLLSASMRLMEVGAKELNKGNKPEAENYFKKAYELYSLFWGVNLKAIPTKNISKISANSLDNTDKTKSGALSKFKDLIKKVVDCCIE